MNHKHNFFELISKAKVKKQYIRAEKKKNWLELISKNLNTENINYIIQAIFKFYQSIKNAKVLAKQ